MRLLTNLALAAVSDELRKYPMVTDRLKAYAGPQCYAHLDKAGSDYRVDVPERERAGQGIASAERPGQADDSVML